MSLDALFFRPGNKNNVIGNYFSALPYSINAPIETGGGVFGFHKDFYKTDEDSANFTGEETRAIRNIGSEINEAYAQGFLKDVSEMLQDATGRTVEIRSDDPPPIRMATQGVGFTYGDPNPTSFNTIYNNYVVPTSPFGEDYSVFFEKDEHEYDLLDEEEEKEEKDEEMVYKAGSMDKQQLMDEFGLNDQGLASSNTDSSTGVKSNPLLGTGYLTDDDTQRLLNNEDLKNAFIEMKGGQTAAESNESPWGSLGGETHSWETVNDVDTVLDWLTQTEEKEEESEYDFVPLIEKEYSTSTSHSPSDLSGFTPSISAALANLNGVAG